MAADNLRHWDALCRTDPRHTKPFQRAGGFRGTATRPIWAEMRLTEHFGPCGIGWGCDEPAFNIVPAGDEILVFCTLACWYMDDGKRATIYGIGGDKVLVKQQSGLRADDEAYKKAFTDALGNAFKHVGSNADIHMGLFEDSKYKAEVAREFAESGDTEAQDARSAAPPSQPTQSRPPPQAATAARLPANPEEPPEVTAARSEARRHFWSRDSYAIDPDVITGGIGSWDAEMLAQASTAPSLDALLKLKEDNRRHLTRWGKLVQEPVLDSFRNRLAAIETRLAKTEGVAA